ncbi:MAG: T9SS type A sorting domain-containing protein [candidate division FCPU426 bacterium]
MRKVWVLSMIGLALSTAAIRVASAATISAVWQIGIGIASSPTITCTPSITPTSTISPTSTLSPTITETATISPTPTITETVTISPTETPTPTETMTSTITLTATETQTSTDTPTDSPTPTATPSHTRTASPTVTPTPSITTTLQPTHSATLTMTPTGTPWVSAGRVLAYPNPARDRVVFAYTVPGASRIEIDIYHLTGERVARIEEGKNNSGQTLTTAWEAAGVAPGIYLCRIKITDANGRVLLDQRKKVAIVR